MRNIGFHVLHEKIHVFLLYRKLKQVDIMSLVDDICTLANVVIANPIRIDLVSSVASFRRVVSIVVIQEKISFPTIGTL